MACCAALTLLFAWIYRVVGWVVPHAEDEFAPPASWPLDAEPIAHPELTRTRTPQVTLGQACIVFGVAWFVAGMLAMHVLHLVQPISPLPLDVAFHMSGLWVATVGLALRLAPAGTVRSAT